MDNISVEERHEIMSRVRSTDTKPEVYFRKLLFSQGYRYRKNVKYVEGKPDLFLRKYNTAIFIHGCFWHRHENCKLTRTPKSNVEFWEDKFRRNIKRDKAVQEKLRSDGIKVLIVWECTVKKMMRSPDFQNEILEKVTDFLNTSELFLSI